MPLREYRSVGRFSRARVQCRGVEGAILFFIFRCYISSDAIPSREWHRYNEVHYQFFKGCLLDLLSP